MFYDFTAETIQGETISMEEFKGQAVLVVNTASECGFTEQYKGLEALYEKYKDDGFVILGFPCNQFGGQEPGSNEEIQNFCDITFQVTFPMMAKIDVNGENEHPLYTFLKSEQGGMLGDSIKWNFTKFLIDKRGRVVARFAPQRKPESIENDIRNLL